MDKETNIHHHFYTRRDWTERKIDALVRNHELSKSIMLIPIHNELHSYVDPIKPPVEREMSERVFRLLQDSKGSYTSLDAAKMLRDAELPDLSEHIGKQIPFLELSKNAFARRTL